MVAKTAFGFDCILSLFALLRDPICSGFRNLAFLSRLAVKSVAFGICQKHLATLLMFYEEAVGYINGKKGTVNSKYT